MDEHLGLSSLQCVLIIPSYSSSSNSITLLSISRACSIFFMFLSVPAMTQCYSCLTERYDKLSVKDQSTFCIQIITIIRDTNQDSDCWLAVTKSGYNQSENGNWPIVMVIKDTSTTDDLSSWYRNHAYMWCDMITMYVISDSN